MDNYLLQPPITTLSPINHLLVSPFKRDNNYKPYKTVTVEKKVIFLSFDLFVLNC